MASSFPLSLIRILLDVNKLAIPFLFSKLDALFDLVRRFFIGLQFTRC